MLESKAIVREGSNHPIDEEVWSRIEDVINNNNHLMRDVLEAFPLYARRIHISRFLIRYELYKLIHELPGCILECGVYRGTGLLTWAKIAEILAPGDRLKKVIGFDNFDGITSLHEKDGKIKQEWPYKKIGAFNSTTFYHELKEMIDIFTIDSYVPRASRVQVVKGDIQNTAPKFVQENPGIRICLLNLDMDVYEPTLAALEHFYPLVVKGGVVILDEYGVDVWGGEAKAFEEYFSGSSIPRLKKMSFNSLPGAYFIKE